MGLIAHLRNQFKSINTFENRYDYIITFIRRGASYRPMDHIALLIKQFKSINTYDYIITLIRRKTPLPAFENLMALYLNKLTSPSTKVLFVPSLVEIGPVVLEKNK